MSTPTITDDAREQALDDVTRRGLALYEERLRTELERENAGSMVAIHPDSGDYAVAGDSQRAMRLLRERQPTGLLFFTRIGPPTAADQRLAERIDAARAK